MAELKWCPGCKANREVKMNINWVIFILLILFFFVGAIIYLIYCYYKKKACAVCKTPSAVMEMPRQGNATQGFCTKCGEAVPAGAEFCTKCGFKNGP